MSVPLYSPSFQEGTREARTHRGGVQNAQLSKRDPTWPGSPDRGPAAALPAPPGRRDMHFTCGQLSSIFIINVTTPLVRGRSPGPLTKPLRVGHAERHVQELRGAPAAEMTLTLWLWEGSGIGPDRHPSVCVSKAGGRAPQWTWGAEH